VVTDVINRFLPDNRRACRTIEVITVAAATAVWALVWWPGAIVFAGLAVLVWSA
jgi:hypothetical protein